MFAKAGKDGIDLLRRMLCFNTEKRISIEDALAHPYLRMFSSPNEESVSKNKAESLLNDNIKLSKNEYKRAL